MGVDYRNRTINRFAHVRFAHSSELPVQFSTIWGLEEHWEPGIASSP